LKALASVILEITVAPKVYNTSRDPDDATLGTVCHSRTSTSHGQPEYKIWNPSLYPFQTYFKGHKN